jgi:hypothetical protein
MAFGRQAAKLPDGSNEIVLHQVCLKVVFVHHELKPMPRLPSFSVNHPSMLAKIIGYVTQCVLFEMTSNGP